MTLQDALAAFYKRNGFGPVVGERPKTVPVFTGCLLVPLPNIEVRHRYLKYHDLHHLVTGYTVGRIGEGEVSAWELGTGSTWVSPTLAIMNLIALSTGLVLKPGRMWRAFLRGTRSRNLYPARTRAAVDEGRWASLEALQARCLEVRDGTPLLPLRVVEFGVYCAIAMFIHALIAIPAVVTRLVTDIMMGYTVFQAVKPKKRTDIY